MIRPSVSAAPPGANGATILTDLVGQLCARACPTAQPRSAADTTSLAPILHMAIPHQTDRLRAYRKLPTPSSGGRCKQ
jgi:hypothetical protein